ncbi:MAG: AraC family transcriptional regulator [Eubacteriales bacterium]|nr:AraC family transcriptional regulator [Eubacteriales bacterium]
MALQKCGLNLNRARKELQPHGSVSFPCAGYASTYTTAPEEIIPWHWHEELEVGLITEGVMNLRIPGQTFSVQTGDLAILNANILHYAQGAPRCVLQSFVFSPLLLTGNADSIFTEKYIGPLVGCPSFTSIVFQQDIEAAHIFSAAFAALSRDDFAYEFTVRESLSHLMLKLYCQLEPHLQSKQKASTTDNRRVEHMMEFIHEHYQDNISLAEISTAGQVGERECLRCFKRTIGESPIQYLLKYRLMQSAQLLVTAPDTSMADISVACGFDAPSYFAKQFKRFYLCTPKDYRKSRIGT